MHLIILIFRCILSLSALFGDLSLVNEYLTYASGVTEFDRFIIFN